LVSVILPTLILAASQPFHETLCRLVTGARRIRIRERLELDFQPMATCLGIIMDPNLPENRE
jgi:hypothetical protein